MSKLSEPIIEEEVLSAAKAKSFPNTNSPGHGGIMGEKLLIISSSTSGSSALHLILRKLPASFPVLVVINPYMFMDLHVR